MEERFTLHTYGNRTLKDKFETVKGYFAGKDPGIKWTDSAVSAATIDYVYQKIVGQETNANRITTIVELMQLILERQDRQDATTAQLVATQAQLAATVAQLVEEIRALKGAQDEPAF